MDAPQVYAKAPAAAAKHLIGFSKINLKPGETRHVTVTADPLMIASFDEAAHDWRLAGGDYAVVVGGSSADAALTGSAALAERRIAP